MSDAPRSPYWWLASDGKWYPPQPLSEMEMRIEAGRQAQAQAAASAAQRDSAGMALVDATSASNEGAAARSLAVPHPESSSVDAPVLIRAGQQGRTLVGWLKCCWRCRPAGTRLQPSRRSCLSPIHPPASEWNGTAQGRGGAGVGGPLDAAPAPVPR